MEIFPTNNSTFIKNNRVETFKNRRALQIEIKGISYVNCTLAVQEATASPDPQ